MKPAMLAISKKEKVWGISAGAYHSIICTSYLKRLTKSLCIWLKFKRLIRIRWFKGSIFSYRIKVF